MKTLFKNALILSMKENEKPYKSDLLVENDKIVKICKEIEDNEAKVIDASNTLLMPSFKNAHAHSAMVFSRSSSDNLALMDWLTKCIFPMEENFDDGDIYNLSKVAFLEYLTSGITSVFDMYFYPKEVLKAADEMGLKVVFLSGPGLETLKNPAFLQDFEKIDASSKDYKLMRIGAHAEYTTSEEALLKIRDIDYKYKMPFCAHASETENEVAGCKERHNGLTPTKYFDSLGLFKYGGTLFHNVVLDDEDIKILKNRNVFAVTCPGSNTKLASGIAPIKKLIEAGVEVAIGTDGAGSNNCLDMFKEMHLLYSLAKIKDNDATSLNAFEILKMATVNASKAMGLTNSLYIEEGQDADIILIDLLRPNMQPINNVVSNLVYSGSKENIKLTMCKGKILYQDYKFVIDENINDIYKKAQEINDRLNATNPFKITID